MTVNVSVQGTGISSTEVWKRMEPVDGYYVVECGRKEQRICGLLRSQGGSRSYDRSRTRTAWSIHKSGGGYLLESSYGGHVKVQHMILGEEVN